MNKKQLRQLINETVLDYISLAKENNKKIIKMAQSQMPELKKVNFYYKRNNFLAMGGDRKTGNGISLYYCFDVFNSNIKEPMNDKELEDFNKEKVDLIIKKFELNKNNYTLFPKLR